MNATKRPTKSGAWQLMVLVCAGVAIVYTMHVRQQNKDTIAPPGMASGPKRPIELTLTDYDVPEEMWKRIRSRCESDPAKMADDIVKSKYKPVHENHLTTVDGQPAADSPTETSMSSVKNLSTGKSTSIQIHSTVKFGTGMVIPTIMPHAVILTPAINTDNTIKVSILASGMDIDHHTSGAMQMPIMVPRQYNGTVVVTNGQSTVAHEDNSSHDGKIRVSVILARIQTPMQDPT